MDPTIRGVLIFLALILATAILIFLARASDAKHARKLAAMSPNERARHDNKRPKIEEVYLEEATLQQEAVRDATHAASLRIGAMPDSEDGLALLGAPVDSEAFLKPSILHERVKRRERWFLLVQALTDSQWPWWW